MCYVYSNVFRCDKMLIDDVYKSYSYGNNIWYLIDEIVYLKVVFMSLF